MKNILKNTIVKLSYNRTLIAIAKKVLVKFPLLKLKLIKLRDSSYGVKNSPNFEVEHYNELLDSIKKEVEKNNNIGKN